MVVVELKLDRKSRQYIRELEDIDRNAFYADLLPFFDKQAAQAAGHIVKTQLSGQALAVRTGNLRRSIIGRAQLVGGIPAIRVGVFRGPALRYAGPQEEGTKGFNPDSPYDTIRPVRAKALAIPVGPDTKTPAGVARFQSPRDQANLEFVPFRRGGNVIGGLYTEDELARLEGNDVITLRDLQASWLLVKEVDLPPRFFLRNGMESYLPVIAENLASFLRDYIADVRGARR